MGLQELSAKLECIKIEVENNILIVTMNRPKAMNALNSQTLDELHAIFDFAAKEDEVYGIILTGEGKAFVAGADIVQMKPYKSEDGRDYAGYAQSTFDKIEDIEKPVIAAVNGYALGGGCELSLSCDIRIASEKAQFGQPEVTLGIIPCFGGTQRLPRLIGPGFAKQMIYSGKFVSAEEALRYGLVNKVVAHEDLLAEAKAMMADIFKVSPVAIKYAKLAINKGGDLDLTNALEFEKGLVGLCFATEDKEIGMDAFLNKEKPAFR
ncbi:enoyl-CoA hydratase-related protein [Anaerotignum sp. MB30-C6]|uniref:enoyl-CoA hydratase-related protein n=1 Tax=Anaerotignum sp. MB30-C6 TaxID=3070814 RepID=UPI0027DD432F|nr:enoyl-CoA hydratase-related protein [Anaerotignum sp. MB30-C6]WMI80076.1 enoyl-CoA hydratase-related protein [Anaerotignum sp. MB30-C6]